MDVIITAIVAIFTLAIGALIGFFFRKKIAEAEFGSAEKQAKNIKGRNL